MPPSAFPYRCPYTPWRHPLDCGSLYLFLLLRSCCFLKSFLLLSLPYLSLEITLLRFFYPVEEKYCCLYNKGAFRTIVELLHLYRNQAFHLLIIVSIKSLICCPKPNLDVPSTPGTSLPLGFWLPHPPGMSECSSALPTDKQIDLSTADLRKLRVKELRRILDDWGEVCKGCAEKSDFIRRIHELMPKYAPRAAGARTDL